MFAWAIPRLRCFKIIDWLRSFFFLLTITNWRSIQPTSQSSVWWQVPMHFLARKVFLLVEENFYFSIFFLVICVPWTHWMTKFRPQLFRTNTPCLKLIFHLRFLLYKLCPVFNPHTNGHTTWSVWWFLTRVVTKVSNCKSKLFLHVYSHKRKTFHKIWKETLKNIHTHTQPSFSLSLSLHF